MYTKQEVDDSALEYFNGDELAASVWVKKYALKDKQGNLLEKTPNDMHRRLAKEFARIENKYSNPLSEDYIYGLLEGFSGIVPQGSPMYGIGNNYQNISLSNCSVIESPDDNMSSIVNIARDMANLYKRRFGVGIDISTLRPDGAVVSNASNTSSGAWSFAGLYSFITRMVGMQGRRGALMITMDIRHPDIEKFVTMKQDLTKVTGANISVKITDDFMEKVRSGSSFDLCFPVDSGNVVHTIKASDLWDKIVACATATAEPGILMWDNICKNLPAHDYPGYSTISTNPCSELPLSKFDSCRLISINLKHFVFNKFTPEASFNWDSFKEAVRCGMRLSDDLVDLELEKLQNLLNVADTPDEKNLLQKFYDTCANGRRTGLGTHGLADLLAGLGIRYDSNEALEFLDNMYNEFKEVAYNTSVDLGIERGVFPVFDWEIEKNNAYINRLSSEIQERISQHGRRNISLLTMAPTGSVSLLSKCSSGIEPVFMYEYTRRKKKNHDDAPSESDYVDAMGDRWEEFKVYHHNYKEWKDLTGHVDGQPIPDYFVTANDIDWKRRIDLQAVLTNHLDHSLSSTVNLPRGTSVDIVKSLYMRAWEKGLKGVTVYVDGCRDGVMVASSEAKKAEDTFTPVDGVKRPAELEADIHHVTIKGNKWTIIVGLLEGNPYEIFGGEADHIELPKKYNKGLLIKRPVSKKSVYDLQLEDGFKLKNIIKLFNNELYQVHTRMISLILRHRAHPVFLVEQLQKDPENDLHSFSKVLARVLKKYVKNGTKSASDKSCPECNTEGLVYQDGCKTCMTCGWTACS